MSTPLFLLLVAVASVSASGASKVLHVPEDVLSFIMGCDGRFRGAPPLVPLTKTDTDPSTGAQTQTTSMVDIGQLRASLEGTVESEEVIGKILTQVEESLRARHDLPKGGGERCTNIQIDVPPQEVRGLTETLQAVVQQNNYQLLEQVNTLFAFKLNSFFKEMEKMVSEKLVELGEGLVKLQQGAPGGAPGGNPGGNPGGTAEGNQPLDESPGETRIFPPEPLPVLRQESLAPKPLLGMREEPVPVPAVRGEPLNGEPIEDTYAEPEPEPEAQPEANEVQLKSNEGNQAEPEVREPETKEPQPEPVAEPEPDTKEADPKEPEVVPEESEEPESGNPLRVRRPTLRLREPSRRRFQGRRPHPSPRLGEEPAPEEGPVALPVSEPEEDATEPEERNQGGRNEKRQLLQEKRLLLQRRRLRPG